MKRVERVTFQCETCGKEYSTEKQAQECEAVGILQDKGAKPGDRVRIALRAGEVGS